MSYLTDALGAATDQIDNHLEQQLTRLLDGTTSSETMLEEVQQALRSATSGGKRFRASSALVGAATHMPGNAADLIPQTLELPRVFHLTSALELYQASALVHDDIVDQARTRRGHPSIHAAMSGLHQEKEWDNDAGHFGTSAAVLLGDWLLAASEKCLHSSSEDIRSRFSTMAMEVAYGQYLDLRAAQTDPFGDIAAIEAAIDVIRLKSARYSLAHPMALGSLLAGADATAAQGLADAIEPAGIAFQLRDDYLGVFGDTDMTGKPAGGDIREGKRTVLLAMTLANAPRDDADLIIRLYHDGQWDDDKVAKVRQLMKIHAVEEHENLIAHYAEQSQAALKQLGLSSGALQVCGDFVELVTWREQ